MLPPSSFHRSLQSGAFLTLLLTLVAISSRLSMVSSELKEACEQADACISRFLILHEVYLLRSSMVEADSYIVASG